MATFSFGLGLPVNTFFGPPMSPSEGKPLKQEIVAEPIEAWRVWRHHKPEALALDESGLARLAAKFEKGENPFVGLLGSRLTAIAFQHTWESRETARCVGQRHEAPDQHCACGIWGLKDEKALHEGLSHYSVGAYGRVQLWGRIIEHERGYRAQYARPLSLTLLGATQELADEIAEFYGCEAVAGDLPKGVKTLSTDQTISMPRITTLSSALNVGLSTAKVINWGFAAAVRGREADYPVLARAVKNMKPAYNTKIEWAFKQKDKMVAWSNFQQIVRTPYNGDPLKGLKKHLQDVELTLEHGRPAYEQGSLPRGLCGGVRHYLGRDLAPGDHIALRPLRDLTLRKNLGGGFSDEWLSEFSLQVTPA